MEEPFLFICWQKIGDGVLPKPMPMLHKMMIRNYIWGVDWKLNSHFMHLWIKSVLRSTKKSNSLYWHILYFYLVFVHFLQMRMIVPSTGPVIIRPIISEVTYNPASTAAVDTDRANHLLLRTLVTFSRQVRSLTITYVRKEFEAPSWHIG